MNKNLKKVISTVAALAISASSMVAFAANYPDVPETASYAQAVQELSALNVISGYEDGTFLPDKNVTRAEITKMIITSLGSATLNAANAAAGQDTKFADVPGSHWASGYVATAAASASSNNGFIDGYSDTEFGPDDNVTFAQATKMLVSALGYKTYAENNGGWPNGYLNYGYTLEIADGVTGVSNDTQVTRAQVAQMIANAVKAPICVVEGYETQWNGTQTPNFEVKDEVSATKKNTWQCLLNYSHDAYVVNGRVVATQKQGGVDAGEVKIDIEKSNNYNGYGIDPAYANTLSGEIAYVGDSKADAYLFTYAEMLLQLNEDDEITILSISPVGGNNKTVEFAAADYAAGKSSYTSVDATTTDTMAVYESADSTATDKYEIKYGAELYVNGVKVNTGVNTTNVTNYIDNNVTGTVTLIDSPAVGKSSVDGVYDYVMVSYYQDAVVDSVVGDDEQATIYFSAVDTGMEATLDVDYTDEAYSYDFTLTDGTALTALDLQENDVVSIAYNVVDGFSNSKTFDVLVSRDTVEGKVVSSDIDTADYVKSEFTINGEVYGLASRQLVDYDDLKVSYEYVLYLDAFGKIAAMEETVASNKLAILDNVYVANGGQYYATIITPDGNTETYSLKDQTVADTYAAYCYGTGVTAAASYSVAKRPIQNRVWAYSVSSTTGNLTLKGENGTASAYTANGGTTAAYKASSTKVGSIRMNEALTAVIDASAGYNADGTRNTSETLDLAAMAVSAFEDEADYVVYGFNKLSDNSYQFVIVTDGTSGSLTYKTPFVVFSKSYTVEVDGEDKTAYLVYAPGATEAQELILDDASYAVAGIVEGTPIVVQKNSAGYVTGVAPLFQPAALGDYNTFAAAVRANMIDGTWTDILNETNLNAYMNKTNNGGVSAWVFGAVYDKSANSITIASTTDSVTTETVTNADTTTSTYNVVSNVDTLKEYDVDADANVITYSYKERAGKGLRVANSVLGTVAKMNVSTAFVDANDTLFAWDHASVTNNESATYGRTSFILAKTIDGDIVEAYVIIPSTTK